ncbi:hypothetical protein GGI23_000549 [Coemansia sp. RSA 2559]|nr:hypothetical protein GGI23_000549 [Coemansia sp. RSA 2559]KAJ2869044.1 hypothetical protein GGI22_000497 [Coemansia erecta]
MGKSGVHGSSTGAGPRSSPRIADLGIHGTWEPPLVVQSKGAAFTAAEIDRAVQRLRRKLRRFLLHKRTAAKLEAMWELYQAIKQSEPAWRLTNTEVLQFLGAILRAGDRSDVWNSRAQQLADCEWERGSSAETDAKVILGLLRIHAKFSDLAGFDKTMAQRVKPHHSRILWLMEQDDLYETKAIALARAGLPMQAEETLLRAAQQLTPSMCSAFRLNVAQVNSLKGQHVWTRPVPPGVVALKELVLAWARNRDVDRAWDAINRLLGLGYAQSPREWNALLHMHALDPRYRYELLERVLDRMDSAGVKKDHATYNIVLQGCLLRGLQARWKDWLRRMQAAGYEGDVYTYMALASQLVATGQWSEALRVIEALKKCKAKPGPAASAASTVVAMRIERQRNRAAKVMARFREDVFRGRHISVHEYALVAAVALDCPARWTTEIALLIRYLEDGCIEENAVVDALAARLPGLDETQIKGRPLLHTLLSLGSAEGDLIANEITSMRQQPGASAAGFVALISAAGSSGRKRIPGALDVVVQALLRSGSLDQAERLIRATSEAAIDVSAPSTLLSILYHMLGQPGAAADVAAYTLQAARFVPPTMAPTALLVASIRNNDLAAAQGHFARLEQLAATHPSARAFNALLYYAQATGDARALERKWRQMDVLGLAPDAVGHRTRITCYARLNDMLRTRRAYTDMLDYGYPPTHQAVCAMVRCCVRAGELDLALTVVRHAQDEHGTALNSTTYNYLLSRLAASAGYEALVRAMFASMLGTSDARLRGSELCGVIGHVSAKRLLFADLRVFGARDARQKSLAAWLLRPEKEKKRPTKGLDRALARWLTSRAAFPAAPTLFDAKAGRDEVGMMATPDAKQQAAARHSSSARHPSPLPQPPPVLPPPPDGTTFIILIRAYGQRKQWCDVIEVWDAMHRFNKRIADLRIAHPLVARYHVDPFSRMVGWVALAYVSLGRRSDARRIWDAAVAEGIMSAAAARAGMDEMLTRLPIPRRLLEDHPR